MQNKLPIGQTAEAAHVGGGGTGATAGNDQSNKDALEDITLERKRPRYSIFAMAVSGPNFYSPAGVWDLVSGSVTDDHVITVAKAPFNMSQSPLSFVAYIDGGGLDSVTFLESSFDDPEKATADEIADVLSGLSGATATVVDGVKVKLASDTSGAVVVGETTANELLLFPLGGAPVEPNRAAPGDAADTFANGVGNSIEFEYEVREPIIFSGGQIFIGEITAQANGGALSGSTTVHVEKVDADDSTKVLSIDTHTHNHGPMKLGPDLDNKNILMDIPGSRSQFSNGERFRFRVVPDGAGYNTTTHGLRGVSAVLWFKALHR